MRQQIFEDALNKIKAQVDHAQPVLAKATLEPHRRNLRLAYFDELLDALVAIDNITREALRRDQ